MDDGICGNDPDDLFAVVDLSDEQDDIATELWNHPGVQDTVNHLNRIAQINKARFNGRTIKKPVSNQSKHMHSGDTPQEVYTLPSEANQFPQVSMGNLRKEFIEFVRRPIEFERQINEQYKVINPSFAPPPIELTSLHRLTGTSGIVSHARNTFISLKRRITHSLGVSIS